VLSVKNNVVEIESIDAFSHTPILDLKPYIPGYDSAEASIPDWLKDCNRAVDKHPKDAGR
jgi:tRNA (Thr-GGU) A37 N-methylase